MIHMGIAKDITGGRYGLFTIASRAGSDSKRNALWNCVCDCGTTIVVRGCDIVNHNRVSCGCLNDSRTSQLHGHAVGRKRTPTYYSWRAMKARCINPNHESFKDYGGRGITIHTEWITSFAQFLADMGDRPVGMTLDRIDCNGNYEPANCKWSTISEQNANQRRWKR